MSSQMVLKLSMLKIHIIKCFRSMSSQMVLKLIIDYLTGIACFRSMSSQMVLKHKQSSWNDSLVLDLCHLKWY